MKNCFKTNWLKQNKGVQAATTAFWLFGFITGSKVVYYMTDGLLYRALSWVGGFAFYLGCHWLWIGFLPDGSMIKTS